MKNYLNYILEKVDEIYPIEKIYNDIKIRTDKTADKYKNAMNILNLDDAVSFCLNNCKEFIDDPKIITRNMDTNEKFFSSKPVERFSRDNINNYTLMMDNSKKWSEFPKRSKAFICSSHFFSKFYVIPVDASKWGICSKDDIFYSFKKLIILNKYHISVTSIKQFFEDLAEIAHNYFGIKISDIDFEIPYHETRHFCLSAQLPHMHDLFDSLMFLLLHTLDFLSGTYLDPYQNQ